MAQNKIDKARLTQSPRELRSSTNDPEKHSKGEVQLGMNEPSKSDGINDGAWKNQGDRYSNKYA
jgi:hypothetical protein